MTINELFEKLGYAADHPKRTVEDYMKRSGKKAIGCMPIYTPVELVHAVGMHPVGLWGGSPNLVQAKRYFAPFICSIMQAILEYGMDGTYDMLSGIISTAPCDALKNTGQTLRYATDIKVMGISHPLYRKEDFGRRFLRSEYRKVLKTLEEIAGKHMTDRDLFASIELFNLHREEMRRFDQLASRRTNTVTPARRHAVMKSAHYMDVQEHLDLVRELNKELKALPEENTAGKRVIISGILYDGADLLQMLQGQGLYVVGDDLSQETRQFAVDVPLTSPDPMECLVRQWGEMCPDSIVFDFDRMARGKRLVALAKEREADGVIFAGYKFCEPEEYDFVMVKKHLEQNGVPLLHIEVDQQVKENQAINTRLQAFSELLDSRAN